MNQLITTDFLQKKAAYWIVALTTLIFFCILATFEGTGDDGDSVQHYMFSRWAFDYPKYFFEQWAKPVYVFLTAPIAQFGFGAIKIFNVLIFAATQILAYWTAQKLNVKNAWLVPFVMFICPMQIYLTPSGLTEPLWAFWFILSVYFAVNQKLTTATIVLSFLPFVRSEGLIIICVWIVYLIVKKRYKLLPFLAVGHLFFMLTGAWAHEGNFFWVFTNMSYATLKSGYGIGVWQHFYLGMHQVTGKFMNVILQLGFVYGAYRMLRYWFKNEPFSKEEMWLIYGTSLAYFIGHTAFWALGLFNSFGLLRVMVGVIPTFAIIIVIFLDFLWLKISERNVLAASSVYTIVLMVCVYSSLRQFRPGHLQLTGEQMAAKKALASLKDVDVKNATLYFDGTSIPYFLGTDYFGEKSHRHCNRLLNGEPVPADALVFWDDWFSRVEFGVSLEALQKSPLLKQIGTFTERNEYSTEARTIAVFKRDTTVVKYSNVILENDFEKEKPEATLSTRYYFSGTHSKELNNKSPFSPAFDGELSGIKNQKGGLKVNLFCKAFATAINPDASPMVVFNVIRRGKSIVYDTKKLTDAVNTTYIWFSYTTDYEFKIKPEVGDQVKIYIWNDHDNSIFIDDLKIRIIE